MRINEILLIFYYYMEVAYSILIISVESPC